MTGGKGGLATRLYNSLRSGRPRVSASSLSVRALGRDLRRGFEGLGGICLVAHPLVAGILSSVCRTWYVHGEIAAPAECAVKGAEKVFVPLKETGDKLIASGADPSSIVVTGLMIEPSLLGSRERVFSERVKRIESGRPLWIGFFTSGAYPSEHVAKIMVGAKSVVDHNMRAIIFTGTNQGVFESTKRRLARSGSRWIEDKESESGDAEDWEIRLVSRRTRQEETRRATQLLPRLDALVAASHERTNWAVGLGIPMFALFPLIGTFAAQNFEFARRQGVTCPLATLQAARNLGRVLCELRESGRLVEMARRGFGVLEVDGVQAVAAQALDA